MKIGNKEKGAIFPTHRNVTLDPFLIYSVTLYQHFFRFSPSFLTSPKRTFFFLSTPSSFCSHSHLVISFSMSVVIKSVETKKKLSQKVHQDTTTYLPSLFLAFAWQVLTQVSQFPFGLNMKVNGDFLNTYVGPI